MNKFELNLLNLNTRPYIHGTSIVKGVLDILKTNYLQVNDFEIRLRKKLMKQPSMHIVESSDYPNNSIATGKFNNVYFYLTESNRDCIDSIKIDEKKLKEKIEEDGLEWYMNINEDDDFHVCLNEVSKTSNQLLFSMQPNIILDKNKQTWFVGYKLPTLDFLGEKCHRVGVSKKYHMITPICMKRWITYNGIEIGERVCIYC